MATIATHNGSSVSRGHNLRLEKIVSKEKHIDPDGIHETWHDEAPRKAYERLFGKAVREYNDRQTRADRKITDYYNEVRDDQRRHVSYEMIIGIYPNGEEQVGEQECKEIMREFVGSWQERNPNLELLGVYYHADEQGKAPHVHIDYVPVAHGYKRGPAVQNGLVKAFGEMGFKGNGKLTAQIQWEKRENDVLGELCAGRGIEVEHPQQGKGTKHLHTELYKAQQELQKTEEQLQKAEESVLKAENRAKAINDSLIPVKAEYEAKKAYVDAVGKDFVIVGDGVQENKALLGGKVKSYTVSAEKWETQAVTRMDREAQKKADRVFAGKVEEFKKSGSGKKMAALTQRCEELEQKNKSLSMENRGLKWELDRAEKKADREMGEVMDRINRVLGTFPETIIEAFVNAWNKDKQKVRNRDQDREI